MHQSIVLVQNRINCSKLVCQWCHSSVSIHSREIIFISCFVASWASSISQYLKCNAEWKCLSTAAELEVQKCGSWQRLRLEEKRAKRWWSRVWLGRKIYINSLWGVSVLWWLRFTEEISSLLTGALAKEDANQTEQLLYTFMTDTVNVWHHQDC